MKWPKGHFISKILRARSALYVISRLANGEILCHMSANQMTGREFAFEVNEQVKFDWNAVCVQENSRLPETHLNYYHKGMVIVKKSDPLSRRGFDEGLADDCYGVLDFLNGFALV